MSKAAIAVSAPLIPSVARTGSRRRVFLLSSLVGSALAIAGFWRTYFGPLLAGTAREPIIIHIHAVVMATWLVLFMAQVCFAAIGKIKLHRQLGVWVMGYSIVLVVVALLATSHQFAARLAADNVFAAQRWLFGPLRDLVCIVPFLGAGWRYRRQPEIHKRVMLIATTIILLPAISRMAFLGVPVPLWKFMLVWPLPVYLAIVHDMRHKRLIHPVYIMGLMVMLAMRLVLPLNTSSAWQGLAAHITALYR